MTDPTAILLATNNAHKVDEIAAVLGPAGVTVRSLADAGVDAPEPIEDADTFEGNALIKANYYAQLTGQVCLADDSGLAVDALDGAPGVYSARFACVTGDRATVDAANNRKLIEELAQTPADQRTARFVCVLALVSPDRTLAQVRGEVEGLIVDPPRGTNGFGYDPHFQVTRLGQTSAELTPAQKNAISHRGVALQKLLTQLPAALG